MARQLNRPSWYVACPAHVQQLQAAEVIREREAKSQARIRVDVPGKAA
jgi:hypothetical protein